MALLTAGYWPTTYWGSNYWDPHYWASGVAVEVEEDFWGGGWGKPVVAVKPKPVPVRYYYKATGEIAFYGSARVALIQVFRFIGSGEIPLLIGECFVRISHQASVTPCEFSVWGELNEKLKVVQLDERFLQSLKKKYSQEAEDEAFLLGMR